MNKKLILIGVIWLVIVSGLGVSIYNKMNKVGTIDPKLQDNKAAQEIAALGVDVVVKELGKDQNGYTIRGQATAVGGEHVIEVALDDDIDANSYEAYSVLYHELGHVKNTGADDTEANADAYAQTRGYDIVDAYHGVH